MVVAEAAEKPESEARVKAAAWAWYQRRGGSVTPAAGRSEAFATRCATRRSTSRFQREAALRARMLASQASVISDSALTSFSSIDNSSSLSQYTASFGEATDPEDSSNPDQFSNPDSSNVVESSEQPSLDLVTLHPTAFWDCGSSLFDSFELVTMSRKLDIELHEPSIDAELGLYTDSDLGVGLPQQQQQVLPLCNTPCNIGISPPSSPLPRLSNAYDAFDTYDKLIHVADKNSEQAVYDMFCQFGDEAKHVSKQTNKRSTIADMATCAGETSRKQKEKPGRMSFHNLAKALHNIRHPYSQSVSSTAIVPQDQHHHPHLHYRLHQQQISTEKVLSAQGKGSHNAARRLGERLHYDDASFSGPQQKQRHIHHHHYHHYLHLFHSDDDFRLQPLDKSLIVAAAGLRSPKVKPALSSYLESPGRGESGLDYGRKWADYVSIPSPTGSNNFV